MNRARIFQIKRKCTSGKQNSKVVSNQPFEGIFYTMEHKLTIRYYDELNHFFLVKLKVFGYTSLSFWHAYGANLFQNLVKFHQNENISLRLSWMTKRTHTQRER